MRACRFGWLFSADSTSTRAQASACVMNRSGRNKPTKPTIETSRVAQHETGCLAHVLNRAIPCIRLYVAKNEASDACFTENRMLGRQQHDPCPFLERGSAPEARPQLRLPRRGGYLSRPSVANEVPLSPAAVATLSAAPLAGDG